MDTCAENKNPWLIIEEGFNRSREREVESILSLGNGFIGIRNSLEEGCELSNPGTFTAGIYENDLILNYNVIVKMPDWTRIKIFIDENPINLFDNKVINHRRYVDLKQGIAVREWKSQDSIGRITDIRIIKFISLCNKHEAGKSLTILPENYSGRIRVLSGINSNAINHGYLTYQTAQADDIVTVAIKTKYTERSVAISQKSEIIDHTLSSYKFQELDYRSINDDKSAYEEWEWHARVNESYTINSLLTFYSSLDVSDPVQCSQDHLKDTCNNFYCKSLKSHISKIEDRWNDSLICITDNYKTQKLINFAVFRLIISGQFSGNYISIPARDLSGDGYKGHIFWDTEMYLLPFFIFTNPKIARNLLLYRYNTLQGARTNAKNEGFEGASFAWESTYLGLEMAPAKFLMPTGEVINIHTGKYENHITPDISYAIWQYWQATQDDDFLVNYGAEIIFEAARFCKSLLIKGEDNFYHIHKAIGPDEYHELVDDNAYTNILVQFNLDIAVKLLAFLKENYVDQFAKLKEKINLQDNEITNWADIKNNIYIGYDSQTGLFEQFKGYFDLEPIFVRDYKPRTAAMDILIGRERTQNSQVIKQPDVLMFLFLLSTKYSRGIIQANYDYYEPRTGHGSSLSPSIHSIVAARLGKSDDAYKYFDQNIHIDLDNPMGNAAGGVHIASIGGTWMAIVMGFAGMSMNDKGLLFDPNLPEQWNELKFSVFWRNQKIAVVLSKDEITFKVIGEQNILISIGFGNWREVQANNTYSAHKDITWHWRE